MLELHVCVVMDSVMLGSLISVSMVFIPSRIFVPMVVVFALQQSQPEPPLCYLLFNASAEHDEFLIVTAFVTLHTHADLSLR